MNRILKNLTLVMGLTALGSLSLAHAQAFKPSKPVEIVVHTGPGGGNDVFIRAVLATLKKDNLTQDNFVVVNKSGGGSANAMNYLREKAGDSHTIGVYASVFISDLLVQEAAPLSLDKITPIAGLVTEPAMLVVRADSPHKTMADLINAAKANPGKLKQSGGSVLSRDAVVRHVLMNYTKADWSFISFPSGGERVSALLGGHVDFMIIEPSEAGEMIRAGKLRPLVQIADRKIEGFPNVPLLREAGFAVPNVPQSRGLIGPPDMPPAAVAYYTDLFKRASTSPSYMAYMSSKQLDNEYLPPAELRKFLDNYQNELRTVLKSAGVKVVR
jgi:putative tricarboxylic transport membrane protein